MLYWLKSGLMCEFGYKSELLALLSDHLILFIGVSEGHSNHGRAVKFLGRGPRRERGVGKKWLKSLRTSRDGQKRGVVDWRDFPASPFMSRCVKLMVIG